jgi:hypothetical protein
MCFPQLRTLEVNSEVLFAMPEAAAWKMRKRRGKKRLLLHDGTMMQPPPKWRPACGGTCCGIGMKLQFSINLHHICHNLLRSNKKTRLAGFFARGSIIPCGGWYCDLELIPSSLSSVSSHNVTIVSEMASAPVHAASMDVGCCDKSSDPSHTVSVSLDRLQRLEACEGRADLQGRHIELLHTQIADTDAILKQELARGEKHAEALMHIARTCDERMTEIKEQHAAALRVKDAAAAKAEAKLVELAASHTAAISKLEAQHKDAITKLEAENYALKAQAASTLTQVVTAITTGTMEILPIRPDRRQFLEWRVGGIPPSPLPPQFDRAWCAAVCTAGWKVNVDAAARDVRAKVTRVGSTFCTLRSAAPLPRQQMAAYRIVVEAYSGNGSDQSCSVGFVPSHRRHVSGTLMAVAPNPRDGIHNYGGWYIVVAATRVESLRDAKYSGWAVLPPADSGYATTAEVPPVPAGGAVEFAVDYAADTCRVAFYTPAAVAGGFVEAPHARMELRFVATAAVGAEGGGQRSVPSEADSGVALYPAVDGGSIWRFAAV